jgi:hypothetical protein
MLVRQRQLVDALTSIRDAVAWQGNPEQSALASESASGPIIQNVQDVKKRRGVSNYQFLVIRVLSLMLGFIENCTTRTLPQLQSC